jgi:dienelactone hydrolase
MNRVALAILAGGIAAALGAEKEKGAAAVPLLPPGKETRLDDPKIGCGHFIVYVPSDYSPARRWPLIACYHGQAGQPTTWPFKDLTAGKGFIILGMGYLPDIAKPMTMAELDHYASREVDCALAAVALVEGRLKVDREQLIVGGFSMGGWIASAMGEAGAGTWAGVAILGAGRRKFDTPLKPPGAVRKKPIYIGCGDKDPNFPAAQKGAEFYRKAGADVTFEPYPGLGHQMKMDTQVLRDWLRSAAPLKAARARLAAARAAEQAGRLGKAYALYDEAAQVSDTDESCLAAAKAAKAIAERAEGQLAEAEKGIADKRYADAARLLASLATRYDGSPFGEKADALIRKLQSDPEVRKALDAAKGGPPVEPPPKSASDVADRECRAWLALADNFLRAARPDKAKDYLLKIIEKHPATDWAAKARERLDAIR